MRKIYTFVVSAAIAMISVMAYADEFSYSLPADNAVLCGEKFNMRLFKTWDFIALTKNDVSITPVTLTTGDADSNLQTCDGYKPISVINEGMEGWYVGVGNIEFNKASGGLYNNKNVVRYVILTGLKAGQIVCIQNGPATERLSERIYTSETDYVDVKIHDYAVNACRVQKASPDGKMPAWTISYLSNHGRDNVVAEITDSIHAEQADNVDDFRYFRVVIDGPLYIAMGKNSSIQGLQVWIDADAEETVSVPSFSLAGENEESNGVEITCGESSYDEQCHVVYGFPERNNYAEPDLEYEGVFIVSPDEDYNGDGKVVIEAVTVSATGVKSETAWLEIDVDGVPLSAPILTTDTSAEPTVVFSTSGAKVSKPMHGVSIVKMSDGTVNKVMMK